MLVTNLAVAEDGAIVACQEALGHLMCTGSVNTFLPGALENSVILQQSERFHTDEPYQSAMFEQTDLEREGF